MIHEVNFKVSILMYYNGLMFYFWNKGVWLKNVRKSISTFPQISSFLFTPIAETPRHGDIVVDTENVLQTVSVYITESSLFSLMFEKFPATFGQFLLTIMKKLSATFGLFHLQHCTQTWKFSAFRQKSPFLKTIFVVFEINIDLVRNLIQKQLVG